MAKVLEDEKWIILNDRDDNSQNNKNITTKAGDFLYIITNANIIVGFYPDQTTKTIVDITLHLNVPYYIVFVVFSERISILKNQWGRQKHVKKW